MYSEDGMSNNLRYITWDFHNRLLIYCMWLTLISIDFIILLVSLQIDTANRYFKKETKVNHYVQLAKHFVQIEKYLFRVASKNAIDRGFYMLKYLSALNVPNDWIDIDFEVIFKIKWRDIFNDHSCFFACHCVGWRNSGGRE